MEASGSRHTINSVSEHFSHIPPKMRRGHGKGSTPIEIRICGARGSAMSNVNSSPDNSPVHTTSISVNPQWKLQNWNLQSGQMSLWSGGLHTPGPPERNPTHAKISTKIAAMEPTHSETLHTAEAGSFSTLRTTNTTPGLTGKFRLRLKGSSNLVVSYGIDPVRLMHVASGSCLLTKST